MNNILKLNRKVASNSKGLSKIKAKDRFNYQRLEMLNV